MEHDWLHADQGYVHFPDTKTDGQFRPIGRVAANLLLAQPKKRDLRLFFGSDFVDRPYSGVPETLKALCTIAKLEGVSPHVLRHTFGSVAGDMGCQSASKRDPLSACKREPPGGVALGLMPGADFALGLA